MCHSRNFLASVIQTIEEFLNKNTLSLKVVAHEICEVFNRIKISRIST